MISLGLTRCLTSLQHEGLTYINTLHCTNMWLVFSVRKSMKKRQWRERKKGGVLGTVSICNTCLSLPLPDRVTRELSTLKLHFLYWLHLHLTPPPDRISSHCTLRLLLLTSLHVTHTYRHTGQLQVSGYYIQTWCSFVLFFWQICAVNCVKLRFAANFPTAL